MEPLEYVSANAETIAETALDLIAIDTQNPPGETEPAAEFIEETFETLGLRTERVVADPAKPNVLATLPGRSETTLVFNGHLDTVRYDTEAWSHDPLGERVGDRVYGRGASDMKGAVASMVATAGAFVQSGTTPPVTLVFAFVSDEEVGGHAGLPTVLERGLDAEACLIGETTCEEGRHSLTVADRGSIWLTLEAEGTAAHGSRPVLGENAIDRLYTGIQTLREEFGSHRLECEPAVESIVDESVEYYAPIMGQAAARDLFSYPSINLGTFEGGTSINAVPESATARIDIRTAPGVDTPAIIDDIRSCAASCEGVTVADVSWSIGTHLDLDQPLVRAVRDTAESVTGDRVYRRSATGGGDAKTLRNAGIPTVEFALGTSTVHAVDEYTTLDILEANAEIYTRLPEAFAALLME